jgi:hypothetical protein
MTDLDASDKGWPPVYYSPVMVLGTTFSILLYLSSMSLHPKKLMPNN